MARDERGDREDLNHWTTAHRSLVPLLQARRPGEFVVFSDPRLRYIHRLQKQAMASRGQLESQLHYRHSSRFHYKEKPHRRRNQHPQSLLEAQEQVYIPEEIRAAEACPRWQTEARPGRERSTEREETQDQGQVRVKQFRRL